MKKNCKLIGGLLMAVLLVAAALPVAAEGFNTTNNLASGVNYSSPPTNSAGLSTGAGVDVQNYKTVGLYMIGAVTNSTAAVIGLDLVRAPKTVSGAAGWETTPQANWHIVVPVPATTNASWTWCTNLAEDFIAPANSVGILNLTNNLAASQVIKSLDIGLQKKIVPIRYP